MSSNFINIGQKNCSVSSLTEQDGEEVILSGRKNGLLGGEAIVY